jgi:hypothetical protein
VVNRGGQTHTADRRWLADWDRRSCSWGLLLARAIEDTQPDGAGFPAVRVMDCAMRQG